MVKNKMVKEGNRIKHSKFSEIITTLLLGLMLLFSLIILKGNLSSSIVSVLIFLSFLPFLGSVLSSFTMFELEFEIEFYGVIISGIVAGLVASLLIGPSIISNWTTITYLFILTIMYGVILLIKYIQKERDVKW